MQPIEEFIIELIQSGDPTVVDRIPNYVGSHIVAFGSNATSERLRIAQAISDRLPNDAIAEHVVNSIREMKG